MPAHTSNQVHLPKLLLILFFLFFCTTSSASLVAPYELVVSKISTNPEKMDKYLRPMADYLARQLATQGIQRGDVVIAKDTEELIKNLQEGRVDLITETPLTAVILMELGLAEPVAIKWKKGVPDYYSMLVTRQDQNINSLDDLVGKVIAFEDPASTTGYFMPACMLREKGYELSHLSHLREKPAPGTIGYVFSGQEKRSSTWLFKKKVAAAAISNLDWNKKDHVPKRHRKKFNILDQGVIVPRAVELVRVGVDPEIKAGIEEALLNAHTDINAVWVLNRYQKTKKFEPLSEQHRAALKQIQEGLKLFPELVPQTEKSE